MSRFWLQTIKHATFEVFSDRFTQEQTSRCVKWIHRVWCDFDRASSL